MGVDEKIVFFGGRNVAMGPCPINPAWVISGAPFARNFNLSRSTDGSACTLLWDCTAGVFNWHYDIDETVYVLEGSVRIVDDNGVEHHLGPGDHALFRAGSHAVWTVESYVRKVAFCRTPVPAPMMFVARAIKKLAKLSGGRSASPAMFGGA
jgi:uncharacterized cupin superfamily protein